MRALIALAFALLAAPAAAQTVALRVGEPAALSLPAAATGLVVGDPKVVEVAVHDARTIFVTGKSIGTTALLAVDAHGRTVLASNIVVSGGDDRGRVSVQAGKSRRTFACDDRCDPAVDAGDDAAFAQTAAAAIKRRQQGD